MKLFAVALVAVIVAAGACGTDEETSDAPTPTATADAPSSTTTSTSPTTTSTTLDQVDPLTVSELLDLRPDGLVTVQGSLFDNGGGPVLCEVLAESFPPQCVSRWVILTATGDIDVTSAEGVTWTDHPIIVEGTLAGSRLIVEGDPSEFEPTDTDHEIIDRLVAFARGELPAEDVDLADNVDLGLSGDIIVTQPSQALADPAAWRLDADEFRARVGPFSALDLLGANRPHQITVGTHNRCAALPVAPPRGLEGLRRLSIEPTDATSCIEWFTVDLFITPDGKIHTITLDLFEP